MNLKNIQDEIRQKEDKKKAVFLLRFFKTGEGQYGQGDFFLGLTVPQSRVIARKYKDLPLSDVIVLLHSKYHEERLIALFILVLQFNKASGIEKEEIYTLYLNNIKYINNWDLVDSSADKIVGEYLLTKPTTVRKKVLEKLARSKMLWERRIGMIATFQFLKIGDPIPTTEIAKILLSDKHDLIQKAVGWMLREMGKRCGTQELTGFLADNYKLMPRTALRYSIEHFPEEIRKKYLKSEM